MQSLNLAKLILTTAFLLFVAQTTFAQHHHCASDEVLAQQLLENPKLKLTREKIERQTQTFIKNGGASSRTIVTIPVVFHIVYNTPAQNVSTAQINSQLAVLNQDFRKLNADADSVPACWQGIAADCEVNFCLAARKPDGTPTDGIERRETTIGEFSNVSLMKQYSQGGLDAWDANKYLNIWVCNLENSLLGYATFPGGPLNLDGIVIDFEAFGTIGTAVAPYNKGRTCTHEVGHWLNIYHIFRGDCNSNDLIADTPPQKVNFGCPNFPSSTCNNGLNGDMWMNYMDYTNDACMYMFTQGQKARMQALFASGGARYGIVSSLGCQPSNCGMLNTPNNLAATALSNQSVRLNWAAAAGASKYSLQWKTSASSNWTTVDNISVPSWMLNGLTVGTTYNFKVKSVCGSNSGSYSNVADFSILPVPQNLAAVISPNQSAQLSWGAVAGASTYSLQWKPSTSSTWTTVNNISLLSYTLSGLATNTTYNFKVKAINGSNSSAHSNVVEFYFPPICQTNTTLSNTGFESGLYPWIFPTSAPSIVTNAALAHSGSKFLQINSAGHARQTHGVATPGQFWAVSVWAKNTNTIDVDSRLTIQFLNAGGSPVATTFVSIPSNTTNYTQFTTYLFSPAGTTQVQVLASKGAGGVATQFDDFCLEKISGFAGEAADRSTEAVPERMEVFPNPTSGDFQIRFEAPIGVERTAVLYDLQGKVVLKTLLGPGDSEWQIHAQGLATGLYLLRVEADGKQFTKKLMVN